jgi:hypothetical protein
MVSMKRYRGRVKRDGWETKRGKREDKLRDEGWNEENRDDDARTEE